MKLTEITQERVIELFQYQDGKLYRRKDGKKMGSYTLKYVRIGIDNKNYKLHRIIFLYHNGYMPKIIDHINGNPHDNRIENLREVTNIQNRYNSRLYSTSKSGVKNVYWQKNCGKWTVTITINGKRKNFGYYTDLEEANQVAINMRNKYLKQFANHGNY